MTPEQYQEVLFALTRINHSLETIAKALTERTVPVQRTTSKTKPSMYREVRSK